MKRPFNFLIYLIQKFLLLCLLTNFHLCIWRRWFQDSIIISINTYVTNRLLNNLSIFDHLLHRLTLFLKYFFGQLLYLLITTVYSLLRESHHVKKLFLLIAIYVICLNNCINSSKLFWSLFPKDFFHEFLSFWRQIIHIIIFYICLLLRR